jgi:predicted nucleotidyltransferase
MTRPRRPNRLELALTATAEALDSRSVPWALVGGLAVSARAEPRATRDIDIAIRVGADAEAERLIGDLRGIGYDLVSLVEQRATGRLATARLHAPPHGMRSPLVDLLFASSGIEAEIVERATPVELLPGVRLRVATPAHLIAMKLLARDDRNRPQDLDDLRALLGIATERDLDEAREAARTIVSRGYGRGRDLLADLEAVRRS